MEPAQALLASGLVFVAHPAPSSYRPSGPNVTKVHVPRRVEQSHATEGVLGGLRELDGLLGALEQRRSPSLAVRPSYSRGDCVWIATGAVTCTGTVDPRSALLRARRCSVLTFAIRECPAQHRKQRESRSGNRGGSPPRGRTWVPDRRPQCPRGLSSTIPRLHLEQPFRAGRSGGSWHLSHRNQCFNSIEWNGNIGLCLRAHRENDDGFAEVAASGPCRAFRTTWSPPRSRSPRSGRRAPSPSCRTWSCPRPKPSPSR
jgi:hypothetical protein